MTLTENDKGFALRGFPILFQDLFFIYPRTLGDIFDRSIGLFTFFQYLKLVTGERPTLESLPEEVQKMEEVKDFLAAVSKVSNFDFLFFQAEKDPEALLSLRKAFRFFVGEDVIFSTETKEIIVGAMADRHTISEANFSSFCSTIRQLYWIEEDAAIEDLSTDDPRTRAIKEKLRKARETVAKIKAKEREAGDATITDLIASITIKIPGINILNVWDLSYYAFYDQLKRLNYAEEYDVNIRAALAGAKVDKHKMKHWIRNIGSINND